MCDHHEHHHDHHEHEHHHDHGHNKQLSERFTNGPTWVGFTQIVHRLDSPVDFYEHDTSFRGACAELGIELLWGRKASHDKQHAYVIPFGEGEDEVFTIWSDVDLGQFEQGAFPWDSYDLFVAEVT